HSFPPRRSSDLLGRAAPPALPLVGGVGNRGRPAGGRGSRVRPGRRAAVARGTLRLRVERHPAAPRQREGGRWLVVRLQGRVALYGGAGAAFAAGGSGLRQRASAQG